MPRRLHVIAWTATLCCVMGLSSPIAAQGRPPQARGQAAPPQGAFRDSLEERVRVRMGQVMRARLGLNDAQMRQLMATNRRFEMQKRELVQQERDVRSGLRDELASGDNTRDAQIAALLDRMVAVQRRRIDLIEAEQMELATFLSPTQRARFFGMEEQVRRRVEEMRDEGARNQQQRQTPPPRRPPAAGTRRPPAR